MNARLLALFMLTSLACSGQGNDNYILYVDTLDDVWENETIVLSGQPDFTVTDPREPPALWSFTEGVLEPRDSHEVYSLRLGLTAEALSVGAACDCYIDVRNEDNFDRPANAVYDWKFRKLQQQTKNLNYFIGTKFFQEKAEVKCSVTGSMRVSELSFLIQRNSSPEREWTIARKSDSSMVASTVWVQDPDLSQVFFPGDYEFVVKGRWQASTAGDISLGFFSDNNAVVPFFRWTQDQDNPSASERTINSSVNGAGSNNVWKRYHLVGSFTVTSPTRIGLRWKQRTSDSSPTIVGRSIFRVEKI